MPSTQQFRRRIKSVNNTKQITKAMEMIASIKMQKAVRLAQSARSYIQNAWNMLHKLASLTLSEKHPLIYSRPVKKTAVILITSDRGLCGSYNSEVVKRFVKFEREECPCNVREGKSDCGEYAGNCDVIAIGKVGAGYVKRYKIGKLVAEFSGFENDFETSDISPISKLSNDEFIKGNYDKVVVIYSHFVSSLKQKPIVKQILPITEEHIDDTEVWEPAAEDKASDYKFEPNPDKLMDGILRQVLRTQIFGAVLEANASEHSARMVAMKNATDNAKNLIDELQLIYNSVRQDSITREIAEISGAAESMR